MSDSLRAVVCRHALPQLLGLDKSVQRLSDLPLGLGGELLDGQRPSLQDVRGQALDLARLRLADPATGRVEYTVQQDPAQLMSIGCKASIDASFKRRMGVRDLNCF